MASSATRRLFMFILYNIHAIYAQSPSPTTTPTTSSTANEGIVPPEDETEVKQIIFIICGIVIVILLIIIVGLLYIILRHGKSNKRKSTSVHHPLPLSAPDMNGMHVPSNDAMALEISRQSQSARSNISNSHNRRHHSSQSFAHQLPHHHQLHHAHHVQQHSLNAVQLVNAQLFSNAVNPNAAAPVYNKSVSLPPAFPAHPHPVPPVAALNMNATAIAMHPSHVKKISNVHVIVPNGDTVGDGKAERKRKKRQKQQRKPARHHGHEEEEEDDESSSSFTVNEEDQEMEAGQDVTTPDTPLTAEDVKHIQKVRMKELQRTDTPTDRGPTFRLPKPKTKGQW
eukprot:CAMPEP_0197042820 /NCGR_PEP_ID=MMETSP1384-20130603/19143_1 /TAXON_ID=29189 /ORGANISM="Ammonia sp." /LENGTH=339 /DNA_ID=CAMNT_0042474001 /DNA_START=802 /DNA_END=1818 /DNA_ORIENTATION=-